MLGTDMKVAEAPKEGLEDFEIDDAYKQWQKKEGVRFINDFAFKDWRYQHHAGDGQQQHEEPYL